MARHTNASKKFFKKPKNFDSDTKTNRKGSLFGKTQVQGTETSTSDDFFMKPGSERLSTFSKTSPHSDRIKKDCSLKNGDTDTSITFTRGQQNQIFNNRGRRNHQQNTGARISTNFNDRKGFGKHDKYEQNSSPQKKWLNQRSDKYSTINFGTSKENSDSANDSVQFDGSQGDQVSKKPFDKKKYRLQKYSKKYRVQQWEDRRKKAIMHEYFKTVSKDNKEGLDVEKIYQESEIQDADEPNCNVSADTTDRHKPSISGGTDTNTVKQTIQGPKAKKKPFKCVQEELKRMKEEKMAKREEFLKKKAEKEEARKKYKKEKIERYKKLSRRTKKGQPIMSDRIEMLLEKIQNNLKD